MSKKDQGIKFGLRKRGENKKFWGVRYDASNGKILSIESGENPEPDKILVGYAKVKNILAGIENQENFRVLFDEKIGALDVINLLKTNKIPKKQNWNSWLSSIESQEKNHSEIKFIIFDDRLLRIEADRAWITHLAENPNKILNFSVYLTREDDPHMFLGKFEVSTMKLIEKGYQEIRLYSFMLPDDVEALISRNIRVRVNVPPVAESLGLVHHKKYFYFTGITEDQTSTSQNGSGKHITLFVKDHALWAQSQYYPGSPVDDIVGNIRGGMFLGDPENFLGWVDFPALMLRQSLPFKIFSDWPYEEPPELLYKSNNLSIGRIK